MTPTSTVAEILRLQSHGLLQSAINLCKKLNHAHQHFAAGWYAESRIALHMSYPKNAIDMATRATELEPDHAGWQVQVALSLFAMGEFTGAAYGIVKDLKAERGRDEAGDYFLKATFYAIRSYRRGTLPSRLAGDPEFMGWVRKMADLLPITASTRYDEVKVHLDPHSKSHFVPG